MVKDQNLSPGQAMLAALKVRPVMAIIVSRLYVIIGDMDFTDDHFDELIAEIRWQIKYCLTGTFERFVPEAEAAIESLRRKQYEAAVKNAEEERRSREQSLVGAMDADRQNRGFSQ